ncbi:hypothetical protein GCM10023194_57050 [Planotetraspora phitsanulokensis]|uniref:Uncharacterized protein n=1 Tax=Planotetraspora phitsanulokensis TaxID=575192 RepID=A0A8J3UG37_9ACTN|nr:hypothetical protein [Planotetraspora phitsanulokensis]GII43062.1 hypothetical protein Pph01_80650 [Planotetraspora phitsanulokensis]
MRRYHQPAAVEFDEGCQPVRFTAWSRTYVVAEEVEYWEELLPWWTSENLGADLEELTVRHLRIRANGPQRSAVVELVQRAGEWFVEGVED